jgi:hypothetical protein
VTVGCTTVVAVKGRCTGEVTVDRGTPKRFRLRVGRSTGLAVALGRGARRRLAKSATAAVDVAVTFRLGRTKVTAHRRVVLRRPRATGR